MRSVAGIDDAVAPVSCKAIIAASDAAKHFLKSAEWKLVVNRAVAQKQHRQQLRLGWSENLDSRAEADILFRVD